MVQSIERISYSFTRDELLDVLLSHGEDCRGQGLLPKPSAVEWTDAGVSLVYEYKSEKKPTAAVLVTSERPDLIHQAEAWPKLVACGRWGRGEGRAVAPDVITCDDCKRIT